MAAHRAGIKTVLLPRHNERDLEGVPEELRQELKVIPIDTAEQVLHEALGLSKVPGCCREVQTGAPSQTIMAARPGHERHGRGPVD